MDVYNANASQKSNVDQLVQLWGNLKRKAKEESSARRKEHFQTGGGVCSDVMDPISDKVESKLVLL